MKAVLLAVVIGAMTLPALAQQTQSPTNAGGLAGGRQGQGPGRPRESNPGATQQPNATDAGGLGGGRQGQGMGAPRESNPGAVTQAKPTNAGGLGAGARRAQTMRKPVAKRRMVRRARRGR